MADFDFDKPADRRGTYSLKYDRGGFSKKVSGGVPMWVADMDFESPPCIKKAMQKLAEFNNYGYVEPDAEYYSSLTAWMKKYHGFELAAGEIVQTPGIVFAINMAVQAFTRPDDAVLVQQPVYYPFFPAIKLNGRKLVNSPLLSKGGRYEIDFADFEDKVKKSKAKLFILCSPHNPVGRVWSKNELKKLGEICARNKCVVASDEVHMDFAQYKNGENKHTVFATISKKFAENSLIMTAPSKTFNLAGLQLSNVVIKNDSLRAAFKSAMDKTGYAHPNIAGLHASKAAYAGGATWLAAAKKYIYENFLFVDRYLRENLPQAKLIFPEGTYLAWVDFRGLRLSQAKLDELILKEAKVWLDSGTIFGPEGRGFERFNLACPRATVKKALERIAAVLGRA